MRHVYIAYPRQVNSNQTMARLKYCIAFDKLAWEEPYVLDTEYLIKTRSFYQYILCSPSKIGCCLGGTQDVKTC